MLLEPDTVVIVEAPNPTTQTVFALPGPQGPPGESGAGGGAELAEHIVDSTAVHGITDTAALVLTGDPRLVDPRTPTGPAGGVLSGSYPNPGFATDLATQAELDAHAATTHGTTHPDLAAHDTLGLTTQAELDAHTADTTGVHGITDTADLVYTDDLDPLAARVARVSIDGGGAPITAGQTDLYLTIPFDGLITGWRLLADVPGSAVLDVRVAPFADFPPTVADSICGADKPTLTAAQAAEDLTPTGWTATLTAGDVLNVNIDSASDVGGLALELFVTVT